MIRVLAILLLCNVLAGAVMYAGGKAWLAVDASAVNQWLPGFVIGLAALAAALGFIWLIVRRR